MTSGYSLLELVITITIVSVLTSISFISLGAPQRLLEQTQMRASVSALIDKAQVYALLRGQTVQLSFTPWTVWLNEKKALNFPQAGPWQWQTSVNTIKFKPDSTLGVQDNQGQVKDTPQTVNLTYNQKKVLEILIDPRQGSLQIHGAHSKR